MYSIQEQESIDHEIGSASELQNAYARSQSERVHSEKIPDDGRFHVVAEWMEYCPCTDAPLGTARKVVASYDTREDANIKCTFLSNCDNYQEYHYEVYPLENVHLYTAPEPDLDIAESDMPF